MACGVVGCCEVVLVDVGSYGLHDSMGCMDCMEPFDQQAKVALVKIKCEHVSYKRACCISNPLRQVLMLAQAAVH